MHAGVIILAGLAAMLSSAAWAQDTASVTANTTGNPAAGPAAPPALKTEELVRDIIIRPHVLPTPEEEKAYHDAEYARLKALFGPPELPPISRGDAFSRNESLNTGTVAGPKAVNCPDIVACYAPPQ
ncbi:hypothetical protein [Azospirillum sp. B4]|uniref:hypothetical protein n=1 Tax=Azospirillum sp. B4 TaxID=95605 RepID=UPI0011DCED42|nr:hypothetical protein [Azospirillum sp. B4]